MSGRRRAVVVVTGVVAALALVVVLMRERPGPTVRSPAAEPATTSIDMKNAGAANVTSRVVAEEEPANVDSHTERVLELVREIESALSSADPTAREEALDTVLAELVRMDPGSAGTLAATWEPGPLREELLARVAQLWVAADEAGAIEWVAHLENDPDRMRAGASLCLQLAESDPADAVRVAQLLGMPQSAESFAALVQAWAQRDLLGALGWTLQRPKDATRDSLLARVAIVQANLQPAQAAQLVATQITNGPVQDAAMLDVMQLWAAQDPEGAATWTSRLRDEALRERVQDELGRLQGEPQPVLVE